MLYLEFFQKLNEKKIKCSKCFDTKILWKQNVIYENIKIIFHFYI